MFELFSAWRTAMHVSEWTGLSVGALAGLAALFWFVPIARKLAVLLAINVVIGWACLMHGDAVGRADVQAQWDAARKAATEAANTRDTSIDQTLQDKYAQALAALQSQKDRADANDEKVKFLQGTKPAKPVASACQLGAAANRVRPK